MELALISVVADTAAAFGVVGSLMLVGFQVRQNSAGLHQAAVQNQISAYQNMASNILDSKDMAEVWCQGLYHPDKLEEVALMRFYAYVSKMLRTFQGIHWQWRRGVLDDELFNSLGSFLEDMGSTPGWQHVWHAWRHQFDSEFQAFFDGVIEEHKGKELYPVAVAGDD
ncbi:MAG TPA: hypothetical protein EYQ81_10330 [Sneathiellales bacterium]|nr:hypothetical protein [Sneathiellales bacterium]